MNAPRIDGLGIERLSMGYGARRILRELDLPALPPGSLTALIGPNGAGKSTLLRGIAGLQPIAGRVLLDGVDLGRLPLAERARQVVYLPQSLPQRTRLCAFEAVLAAAMAGRSLSLLGGGHPDAQTLRGIEQVLEALDLSALADRPIDALSGGQRQLVGLAQALVRQPRVLLLDEPTSALDLYHQCQVAEAIVEVTRARGLISLMVVHDINLALACADQVLVLHQGGLAAAGPPAEVIDARLLREVYGVHGSVERVRGRNLLLVEGRLRP
ncbi:iron complex transport system ATP-binding protein [Pseudomonas citronellolis]|uniref:ABC transporter ATP-binding protein n=1 Tax=Pseudomonas citronellolis TaxID=53408 RepID=UPI0020A1A2CC|nr:ABC transporter ATP-binding protein [Pseudomonas citronellolis]MCP1643213.1 iron complex transport system ATP-binding protein [Pseudomonas citronellolis]MCP1666139.1 iron complex transport system ATP-binding protein [Pseudomonas citronellolis]MCP1698130.1 iron complex transport system ATP-binding protein [Pseudomonas citronellolis]MCP1703886.1 iron complex transport system ATP-binding protein [Pseudomonas citronellolis]MCP1797764.1 iron complex transport system ATP-binding protein [Pseudomo